ncbi:MAG: OmpA family protein [Candidatus Binataceae bacterium]
METDFSRTAPSLTASSGNCLGNPTIRYPAGTGKAVIFRSRPANSRWTPYREITFDRNGADIEPSGMSTISEIATYMAQNPSLELGIDGSINSASTEPTNQDLSNRRVSAVRDALVQAGVPASRIQAGSFSDPQLRRNRRVDVLLKTGVQAARSNP